MIDAAGGLSALRRYKRLGTWLFKESIHLNKRMAPSLHALVH